MHRPTDATAILPRRIRRRWRITEAVYSVTWPAYRAVAAAVHDGRRRERVLSYYGPGSLLFTIALWFSGFILGYALALWAFAHDRGGHARSFGNAAYIAASMVFTLGLTAWCRTGRRPARSPSPLEAPASRRSRSSSRTCRPCTKRSRVARHTSPSSTRARARHRARVSSLLAIPVMAVMTSAPSS